MIAPFSMVSVIFYAFAALLLLSALMVILAKNPVQSALYLVVAFLASAVLWIMLEAEFLGLILVLVYVGAVMTLFLFVIMTIASSKEPVMRPHRLYFLSAFVMVFLMLGIMIKMSATSHYELPHVEASKSLLTMNNTQALGFVLYTVYLYPFEVAGLLLLVAIIAAISLHVKSGSGNNKRVDPSEQVKVTARTRLRIIAMPFGKKNE